MTKLSTFDQGYEDAMDGCDPVLDPDQSYQAGYREGVEAKLHPKKAKNRKDSFMIFAVSMGILILGVLVVVGYAAGYLLHWWK